MKMVYVAVGVDVNFVTIVVERSIILIMSMLHVDPHDDFFSYGPNFFFVNSSKTTRIVYSVYVAFYFKDVLFTVSPRNFF